MAVKELEFPGLPTGAFLVRVGNEYRVQWDLGDGLGYAWYDTDEAQLKKALGPTWSSQVAATYGSEAAFEGGQKKYFWGNLAEVDITSETPWQDLKDRVFATFGPVSGLDEVEIKRLALQGFFESWSTQEFLTFYKATEYYNTLNDKQREWSSLSEAERTTRSRATAVELLDYYRQQWGYDPPGGLNNQNLLIEAEKVAGGLLTMEEFQYNTRTAAEDQEGTPAQIKEQTNEQNVGAAEVSKEDLAAAAADAWRKWVGPTDPPAGWTEQWANDLFMNTKSEADLETYLKSVSLGRWGMKDPNVSWEAWAAPWKSEIARTLELGQTDDADPLLNQVLSTGLTGQEAINAIRGDARFKETNTMRRELQDSVTDLGRRFGFIT